MEKTLKKALILVLSILTFSIAQDRTLSDAFALNKAGMAFYQSKEYYDAALKFKAAIAANPRHALAHYNLACMYALLLACGEVSQFEYDPDTVFSQLQRAIALDTTARKRALHDRDFDNARSYVRFYKTIGFNFNDSTAVKKILQSVTWYTGGCGAGVYGCSYFTFLKNGSFTFKNAGNPFFEGTPAEEKKYRESNNGTYSIVGNKAILKYFDGHSVEYFIPTAEGIMKSVDGKNQLSDKDPDPCSA